LLAPANAVRTGLRALVPASRLNANPQQSLTLASSPCLSQPPSTEEKYLGFSLRGVGVLFVFCLFF